jgi:hypothetical protein
VRADVETVEGKTVRFESSVMGITNSGEAAPTMR